MIDQVDLELQRWVQTVVGEVSVFLSRPEHPPILPAINLYLLELAEAPTLRSSQRPPLQIYLHYLLTSWADDPLLAHHLLGQLLFAAMQKVDCQVDLSPLPAGTWAAFGLAPQPAFILSIPLRLARPETIAPLVRQPLVVNSSPLQTIEGLLLGPEEQPLVGAKIELPALARVAYSDSQGKFELVGLPAGQPAQLRLTAKGQTHDLTIRPVPAGTSPLTIRLDLLNKR